MIHYLSQHHITDLTDIAYVIGLIFACVVSAILAYLMNTYRGKTYLERLLFLRECLIALIIGRILLTIAFDLTNTFFVIGSWYAFCFVCGLIIISIVKEHIAYNDSEDYVEEETPYDKG